MNSVQEIFESINEKVKSFFENLDDTGIVIFWVALILLFSFLFWGTTNNARNQQIIKRVNKVLLETVLREKTEDYYYLVEPVKTFGIPGRASSLGKWYIVKSNMQISTKTSDGEMLIGVIFPLINDGVFLPCLAICNSTGSIRKVVPLGESAAVIVNKIPENYKSIFYTRVENAAKLIYAAVGTE
jgi:hypothetical protein